MSLICCLEENIRGGPKSSGTMDIHKRNFTAVHRIVVSIKVALQRMSDHQGQYLPGSVTEQNFTVINPVVTAIFQQCGIRRRRSWSHTTRVTKTSHKCSIDNTKTSKLLPDWLHLDGFMLSFSSNLQSLVCSFFPSNKVNNGHPPGERERGEKRSSSVL